MTPFTYAKTPTTCPCGEHSRFNKLTSHTTGGKCWTCNKFFPPERESKSESLKNYYNSFTKGKATMEQTPHSPSKIFIREHIYWDEAGDNYLMKIMIYKDSSGKKQCYQYKWEGKIQWNEQTERDDHIGTWVAGIEGVNLTLYNAPLLDIFKKNQHRDEYVVYIVEGEKDADTIWHKCGQPATCNPMGAGKWKSSYSDLLKGLNCIILPDNDEVGKAHAQMVYNSLKGIAHKVTIINLTDIMPDLPHKGDVSDFLERGGKL